MSTRTARKRLAALAAAGALALAMAPAAFAASDADLELDGSISVSGLQAGDTANYYQVIEQDLSTETPPYVGTQDWKLSEAVDSDGDLVVDGTENMEFGRTDASGDPIKGLRIEDLVITDDEQADKRVITRDMANAIASAIVNNEAAPVNNAPLAADATGKVEVATNVAAGMYMFVAVPGAENTKTVYKPVFVSNDYHQTGEAPDVNGVTNKIALVADETDYKDEPAGVFKKSELDIDKESGHDADAGKGITEDRQTDVKVGDVVDFTITVPIPTYTTNFADPKFDVTDVLTDGLELVEGSVAVVVKNGDSEVATAKDVDYTITEGEDRAGGAINGFVVRFLNDNPNVAGTQDGFLYKVVGAPTAIITYRATVTSAAGQQINQMDNTATLNFTNEPEDDEGAGELKDKTRHYTFDIDADVFGGSAATGGNEGRTSELRKVAIDADGTVIQQETTSEIVKKGGEESTKHNWLQDVEFKLVQTQYFETLSDGSVVPKSLDGQPEVKFNDAGLRVDPSTAGAHGPKSDQYGYIPMKGLDAGTYKLTEVSAPLGYTFDPTMEYTITITPAYAPEEAGTTDGDDDLILESYTVTISCPKLDASGKRVEPADTVTTTCVYTAKTAEGEDGKPHPISFLNDAGTIDASAGIDVAVESFGENTSALITNKKLGILPATGGSGIFFYLGVGAVLMALAVALGLLKRRSNKSRD